MQKDTLVSTCNNVLKLWNLNTLKLEHIFEGHTDDVTTVQVDVDLDLIASCSKQHFSLLYSL